MRIGRQKEEIMMKAEEEILRLLLINCKNAKKGVKINEKTFDFLLKM